MTSQQLQKVNVPLPFAGGQGASKYTFGLTSAGGTDPNFTDGFPSAFSAPKASGGKFILRSHMNGLGNAATADAWFHQGGGFYTFDAAWSNAQHPAGYPQGAILHHVVDGTYVAVRSLVDNNTWDFTIQGIDGVHWEICSAGSKVFPNFDVSKRQILWDNMANIGETLSAISENFVMPFDGYVNYLSSVTAQIAGLNISMVTGIAAGATSATATMIPFVPTQVLGGSMMGIIMGITTPTTNGSTAADVSLDLSNYISGTRNCSVFNVDGMGLSSGGAGCGLIPVKKGSKIRLYGKETFSKTYNIQMQQQSSTGSTSTITVQTTGSFHMAIRVEAYPIIA